jgi:hypothetical protein
MHPDLSTHIRRCIRVQAHTYASGGIYTLYKDMLARDASYMYIPIVHPNSGLTYGDRRLLRLTYVYLNRFQHVHGYM